ncbi:MAG: hypothetical protein ACRDJE_16100 [Dehalococcoidia bacterium]
MRRVWHRFRLAWPRLPLIWKLAIIGLALISVVDTIRLVINLLQGQYF